MEEIIQDNWPSRLAQSLATQNHTAYFTNVRDGMLSGMSAS